MERKFVTWYKGCQHVRECYKCGKVGHLQRLVKTWYKGCQHIRECYKCGKVGHLQRDCTGHATTYNNQNIQKSYAEIAARTNLQEEVGNDIPESVEMGNLGKNAVQSTTNHGIDQDISQDTRQKISEETIPEVGTVSTLTDSMDSTNTKKESDNWSDASQTSSAEKRRAKAQARKIQKQKEMKDKQQ
ncbi:hypothetical protein CHS0354_027969 [Potamilus streckersoni]|uniref:CCHC-type domain-containing protein n=1 Tax=Potamilus streckersoni TaxID=2493646 RepID=A0AAE0T4A5_9BIVA|nr:hypothetical protein CHS0354_027969 [Potamilus streckersoni]